MRQSNFPAGFEDHVRSHQRLMMQGSPYAVSDPATFGRRIGVWSGAKRAIGMEIKAPRPFEECDNVAFERRQIFFLANGLLAGLPWPCAVL
jgi:hypothetical protein